MAVIFVVVWQSRNQDGSGQGVFGQRLDPDALPLGIEFQVNFYTPFDQQRPSVAVAADGDFVVVWESADQDGSGKGIFGQRFAADTSPLGDEFQVNTYTTGSQYAPAVASNANGDFVVVWPDGTQDGSVTGIFSQRFTADGTPAGVEFSSQHLHHRRARLARCRVRCKRELLCRMAWSWPSR